MYYMFYFSKYSRWRIKVENALLMAVPCRLRGFFYCCFMCLQNVEKRRYFYVLNTVLKTLLEMLIKKLISFLSVFYFSGCY